MTLDEEWRAGGTLLDVAGDEVFVRDEPAAADRGNHPLLVLHGFPTCSFDFVDVLPALAADRRVVLPDLVGYGFSSKPDRRYGIRQGADVIEGVAAALGLEEVDLLTHDLGDSVGGELLARELDGTLGLRIMRRVITNGSIYMDLVQLSVGQQFLLGLPDEATDLIDETGFCHGVAGTCAPAHQPSPDHLAAAWRLAAHNDGHRLLPRLIRYIEDRRAEEGRYTGAIENHPSPLGIVWGDLDPIAVYAMAQRLHQRTDAPLITLDGVGHYPMVETPDRFATAVLGLLNS